MGFFSASNIGLLSLGACPRANAAAFRLSSTMLALPRSSGFLRPGSYRRRDRTRSTVVAMAASSEASGDASPAKELP